MAMLVVLRAPLTADDAEEEEPVVTNETVASVVVTIGVVTLTVVPRTSPSAVVRLAVSAATELASVCRLALPLG